MTKDAIKVKLFNSKSKGLEVVPAAEISKKIKMVENGKIAAVEETVQVEVAPENKPEVEASKDTVDSFTSDAARVKNAINDVMANTGKDNSNNIQNIIDINNEKLYKLQLKFEKSEFFKYLIYKNKIKNKVYITCDWIKTKITDKEIKIEKQFENTIDSNISLNWKIYANNIIDTYK